MVGKLVADFSPENVVEAARALIIRCEHDMDRDERAYVTQAGIIADASTCGWNDQPSYKAI